MAGVLGWKLYGEYRISRLTNRERFNIVIVADSPTVISINPQDKTAVVVPLPGDIYFPAAEGYGDYRLKAVYKLGELDRKGGRVLAETVGDILGIPIDGFILIPDFPTGKMPQLDQLFTFGLLTQYLQNRIKTNLSLLDIGQIIAASLQLRFDKIKVLNLRGMGILDELVLADGSKALSADLGRLDYLADDNFVEPGLRRENLKIEVLNAGTTAGLGSEVSRVLSRIGLDIINVGNQDIPVGDCEVRSENKWQNTLTVRRIAGIFSCRILPKQSGRADVTVILRSLRPGE